ncbi:hypothetical protein A2943_03485 [Candidatus Adlerbacteria bacterium RIFCSPLOWO2_01_FULL_51_16]|uniref:Phosphatidic acid phosphatase type 2/haloperoxidase domain-containing protein n=1 Tax=Candidatus Adlerbacteria bacterium RIFCSPLOWO2_01_FULL_51_16 TaxID=1797243 RepID=A0A1F4XEX3_9BACT|nr:MAG: hypothetical protein A2943_03485 [Candidatus Adlerbacteria bacterium RIFCSPLOWO2_01_FULL_51_16]
MFETLIIFGANYLVVVPALALLAYWFVLPREKKKELALLAIIALPLGYVLARIAGLFYFHPQPFVEWDTPPLIPHEVDNAFPSDHVALAGALATIAFSYNQWLGVGLWFVAFGIGCARIGAGLHYPGDIIVGAVLGAVAVFAAARAIYLWNSVDKREK